MSENCSHCGSGISAGLGQYSADRGFLCNTCNDSLHIVHCSSCGQRYSSYDMKDVNGKLLCNKDARVAINLESKKSTEPSIPEPEETSFIGENPKFRPLEAESVHDDHAQMIIDLYKESEAPEPFKTKQSNQVSKEETLIHHTEYRTTGFILKDGDGVIVEEIISRRIKYTTIQKGKQIISKFLSSLDDLSAEF